MAPVVAIATTGLAVGALALPRAFPASSAASAFGAYAAAVALAAVASLAGFALLRWGTTRSSAVFQLLLLGSFPARVALAAALGLLLRAAAPAHVAVGLLTFAGFHFVFVLFEVALLARVRPRASRSERPATTG